jgi:hypothetical protein
VTLRPNLGAGVARPIFVEDATWCDRARFDANGRVSIQARVDDSFSPCPPDLLQIAANAL